MPKTLLSFAEAKYKQVYTCVAEDTKFKLFYWIQRCKTIVQKVIFEVLSVERMRLTSSFVTDRTTLASVGIFAFDVTLS